MSALFVRNSDTVGVVLVASASAPLNVVPVSKVGSEGILLQSGKPSGNAYHFLY
jgi:hypothetical protein